MTKGKKVLYNAFWPLKGLHQTKIVFLLMELYIWHGRKGKDWL